MLVELRDIATIKPYKRNPRVNDGAVEALAENIRLFGWRVPIILDADGTIIAGHTRLKAAVLLGLTQVPVHVAHGLSPEQCKALRLAENRSHEMAAWDYDLLPIELAELKALDFDIESLGWSPAELSEIMAPPVNSGESDPDEVPEPPAEPVTQLGDLWLLGEHRLLCGDSTSIDDVQRIMDGKRADLCQTDPPYGVEYEGKTKDALQICNDDEAGLAALLDASLGHALSVSKPGAVWYVAAPAGPQFLAFATVLTKLGVWRQTLAWVKDSMVLGHSDFHYRHEAIFYGWAPGKHRAPPNRTFTTVLEFPRPKASREHPTMKPIQLWSLLMAASTAPGALVYEPFSGSGTTIIAAEQQGRVCYAVELEPRYVDVAVARWEAFTGRKAERVPAAETANAPLEEKARKSSRAKEAA
jgi:DNA modification methylase